ncbi:MAG: IMP dehydrogenase [Candidatus Aenigmarchaeota archaeon]|nr:IMP dehydrogenase [Candidatus Aenigmarchaeota archaeon]
MAGTIIDSESYFSRTLQEYLLLPGLVKETISVDDVDLSVNLTKGEDAIRLRIPILTAAMQSVTGDSMATAIARLGGAGVIYCSQPIADEAKLVRNVKRVKAGFVVPDVLLPSATISDAYERMRETGYSKFPVTEDGTPTGRLLGLLTDNDFDIDVHASSKVYERMKPLEELDVAYENEITDDIKRANRKLREGHHSVLPIITSDGRLKSLVFRRDMRAHEDNPYELLDDAKRYAVGAAVNTHDYAERAKALIDAEADFLVIDTSQGYSEYLEKTLRYLKREFPHIPVVAGNIVTADGFRFLVDNGADAVKIGMGSGSICITQEQIRVGRGQASAVLDVSRARDSYYSETSTYIPICSDGGIMSAGDIQVALALGADYVMAGGYVAGTEESNGPEDVERREVDGKWMEVKVKRYWGEGSRKAQEWSGLRYGHTRFEEGFETTVPYTGPLRNHLMPALAQIRDGIRKSGSSNIPELHANAILQVMSPLSITLSRGKPATGYR